MGSGGAERVMLNFIEEVKSRIGITLIINKAIGEFSLPKDIDVICLNTTRVIFTLPKLFIVMINNNFDYFFTTKTTPNIIGILSSLLSNTKCIIRIANMPSLEYYYSKKRNSNYIIYILAKLTFRYAHKILTVSEAIKFDLYKFYNIPAKKIIKCIYSPIIDDDEILGQANEMVEETNLFKSQFTICAVGRIAVQKDYLTLLKALKICSSHLDLDLIIIGRIDDHNYYEKLKSFLENNKLSDKVHFLGFKRNPNKYVKMSSIFVLSSIYEGMPGALIKALRLQSPFIATNPNFYLNEVINKNDQKWLIQVKNHVELANKIKLILSSDIPLKSSTDVSEFDISNASINYLKFINE